MRWYCDEHARLIFGNLAEFPCFDIDKRRNRLRKGNNPRPIGIYM